MIPGKRNQDGSLAVTSNPVSATSSLRGGIAVSDKGEVHIFNGAPTKFVNGYGVTQTGQLVITGDASSNHLGGYPRTALGALKGSNNQQVNALDPFVGGIRVGSAGIYMNALNTSGLPQYGRTLLANLTSSLILNEGAGNPTYSMSTAYWSTENDLGLLLQYPAGSAFFGGARLVRNTVRTKSEDFSNAAWVKSELTISGTNTLVCKNATTLNRISQDTNGVPVVVGQNMRYSARVQYVSGGVSFVQLTGSTAGFGSGQHANFSLLDGTYSATGCTASSTLVSPGVYDISIVLTAIASGNQDIFYICITSAINSARFSNFVGDGVKSFELLRAWSVDVTGYNASYVPEYISVGVVAAPFFGAGIDGARYYETDWQGAPIPAANLKDFLNLSAATNNLLYSRDFPSGLNTAKWVPSASGAEQLSSGTIGLLGTATAATYNTGSGVGTVTRVDGSNQSYVAFSYDAIDVVKVAITNTGALDLYVRPTGFGSAIITIPVGQSVTGYATGYANYYITTATGTGTFTVTSMKNTDLRITKTATGLDGIANTATTLTATAADAIILQPITLASADRCASVYVRRRTGTGTVSFTQNGGSNWTDITAQINSSTWSRVQITATLANPSVGFKISTSGDAIDVDVVQNEAGTVATPPIVTTTAAVSRGANSLTYQKAGNIDFAAGTIYCEAKFASPLTTRRAVLIGPDGYSYIDIGDANTSWKAYDGTNTVSKSGLSDISTAKRKRVVAWGAGLKVTGDGLAPASGPFDGSFGSGATITVGQNIGGYTGTVAIYNHQMTDAELQAITA